MANCHNAINIISDSLLYLLELRKVDLLNIIHSTNNKSLNGLEGILSTKKMCFLYDIAFAGDCQCINKRHEFFPSCLKKSTVKLIHKEGSRQGVDNYHPVTSVPTLLEKIISKEL
jgi:hypothetical protein